MTSEQIETVVLTAILSLLASILTAFLTSKATRENEMRKRIHEKRLELYLEFHDVLEKMLRKREIVFDKKYYQEIRSYKARIKLLASKNTVEKYKELFEYVQRSASNYEKYLKENDPAEDPRRVIFDDDGNQIDYEEPTGMDYDIYDYLIDDYKAKELPSKDFVQKMMDGLYTSMRNDLGSNLK